jgi:large conductance mechanosensitive channel
MSMLQEFKQFALKGSVVDLAVGVIIGGAFGKIVGSLVDNILMPPLGMLIGGVDFSQLKLVIKAAAADGKGEVALGYGVFLQNSVNFLIVAWALFLMIQTMNRLRTHETAPTAPPAAPPEDVLLLREIRDSLRVKGT